MTCVLQCMLSIAEFTCLASQMKRGVKHYQQKHHRNHHHHHHDDDVDKQQQQQNTAHNTVKEKKENAPSNVVQGCIIKVTDCSVCRRLLFLLHHHRRHRRRLSGILPLSPLLRLCMNLSMDTTRLPQLWWTSLVSVKSMLRTCPLIASQRLIQ